MPHSDDNVLLDYAQEICKQKNWRFVGRAGAGVFKATFNVLREDNEKIALKVYRPGVYSQRTEREVSALKRLQHNNLPAFFSLESVQIDDQEVVFSTEEFLDGGTLTSLIRNEPLSPDQIQQGGEKLIDALVKVAELRLVHRDIKPDNIMFRNDGVTPVIVDFGLVRDLEKESLTATWAMRGPGTPLYAPPEQLNNDKALIDCRSDQFSLGIVLSKCGFGNHPYARNGDGDNDIVNRVSENQDPSNAFTEWAESAGLNVLVSMVQPWPVQRICTPDKISELWQKQTARSE